MDRQTKKKIVLWTIGSTVYLTLLGCVSYVLLVLYAICFALGGGMGNRAGVVGLKIFFVLLGCTAPPILFIIFLIRKGLESKRLRQQVKEIGQ